MEAESTVRWLRQGFPPWGDPGGRARLLRRAGLRRHAAGGRGGQGRGVTKGTAYLYFKSKEELFKAVVSGYLVPAIEQFEAAARAPGPVSELLVKIGGLFFEKVYSTRFSALPKLVISEASNFPELRGSTSMRSSAAAGASSPRCSAGGSPAASSARSTSRTRSTA